MSHAVSALAAVAVVAVAGALAFAGCATTPAAPAAPVAVPAGPDAVLVSMLVSEDGTTTLTPRVVIQHGSRALFSTAEDGQVEVSVSADTTTPGRHHVALRYTRDGALQSSPPLLVCDDEVAQIEIGDGTHTLSFELLLHSVDTMN